MDPIAQGNEAPVEGNATPATETPAAPVQQASNPHEGFQARINELTAKFRETERALQARDEQLNHTLALLSQAAQKPQEDPQPQFDTPEEAAKFTAVMSPMERRVQQLESELRASQAMSQVGFLAQQMGVDQSVAARAAQLMSAWQRSGKQGWVPEDAVIYAEAQLLREARAKGGQANAALQSFNAGHQPLTAHAPPPPPAPRAGPTQAEVDGWDVDKQLAFYEKKLGNKAF